MDKFRGKTRLDGSKILFLILLLTFCLEVLDSTSSFVRSGFHRRASSGIAAMFIKKIKQQPCEENSIQVCQNSADGANDPIQSQVRFRKAQHHAVGAETKRYSTTVLETSAFLSDVKLQSFYFEVPVCRPPLSLL